MTPAVLELRDLVVHAARRCVLDIERTRVSVVLVCHELEVLPPSCREVVLLDAGRIADRGSPEGLWTDARVKQLYGGGLRVVHSHGRHGVVPTGKPAVDRPTVPAAATGGAHA